MSSPLFQSLMGQKQPQNNNFMNMVQQFVQFKQNFRGNPKEQVLNLISSGKMSQQQFEQYKNMAQQFESLLK